MRAWTAHLLTWIALGSGAALAEPAPDLSTPPDAVLLPPPSPTALTTATDSIIASMTAGVDEDTLYAFLEKLTGEVPVTLEYGTVTIRSRYSYGVGVEHATEFLARTLESYGFQVEIDYYAFPHNLEAVRIDPSGSSVCVGGRGRILRTDDFVEWTRTRQGVVDFTGAVRDVDRIAGGRFVAVGDLGFVATSLDAGASWVEHVTPATQRLDAVSTTPSGAGWAVGRSGMILRTTDGGDSWQAQASGTSAFLRDVAALADLEAVAVGEGGTILRTTDGGTSWSSVASGVSVELGGVDFVGDLGWTAGDAGTVLHSTDRGATWSPLSAGATTTLQDVSFADASTGWIVGTSSTILHTTDAGATWSAQTAPSANMIFKGVRAVSTSEAWVVGVSGTLLRTTDGGATWESRLGTIRDGWANVVATLPGRTVPEEEVILLGHFDSTCNNCGNPALLAPGADDNGSGTAVLVESARRLAAARFGRTIRILCVSGEEQGLIGSEAYASRAEGTGQDIVAVFNFDMVGWNDDYLRIFSNDDSGWLGTIAHSAAATYAPDLTTHHWWCANCISSDQRSFWDHGFDSIVAIEPWDPPPPNYHKITDVLASLDLPMIANVTRIAVATAATVAGVDTTAAVSTPLARTGAGGLRLDPVYPNPSAGTSSVRYIVPRAGVVRLGVYDVGGRLVSRLMDAPQTPGTYVVRWEGTDGRGRTVAPGIYFYRLEAGEEARTRSLTIVR